LLPSIDLRECLPDVRLLPRTKATRRKIRQMIDGRYRILFTILPGRVVILHVRHGARLPLRPE
jgi:plasmid stabilization system protein ParE